ncbi:MAG TPA: methylated-DNA--[protein]-cysteine S-methyltransferase [Solirubrobacteraceae bacterium]|nr:methylated-DNA--[protein]-cysteine S-methyltransferase [Solirubrobacteraceae bacterium]
MMIIDSPVGPLTLVERDGALARLSFGALGDGSAPSPLLDRAVSQLHEYFAGERRAFDLPLAPSGTEFQLACWRALAEIPYGETRSYGEQARRIGRPDRARAVGAANGANPIAIILPCHRVIGADGSLVGFGGGLETKRQLLDLEAGILTLI